MTIIISVFDGKTKPRFFQGNRITFWKQGLAISTMTINRQTLLIRALVQSDVIFVQHLQNFRVIVIDPQFSFFDTNFIVDIDRWPLNPLVKVDARIDRSVPVDAHAHCCVQGSCVTMRFHMRAVFQEDAGLGVQPDHEIGRGRDHLPYQQHDRL